MKTNIHIFRVTIIFFLFLFLHLFTRPAKANTYTGFYITTPANGSSVTSPILINVDAQPTDNQLVRVNLFDPNGTLLARQLLTSDQIDEQFTGLTFSIVFDIPQVESPALLTVDTLDSNFQTQQTRSVLLSLMSNGEANLLPKDDEENWLIINSIETIEQANGNQIYITGSLIPITDKPVHFELTTVTGRTIGSRQLSVQNPGITTGFTILIPFESSDEPAHLVVRQTITPYRTNLILDRFLLNEHLP